MGRTGRLLGPGGGFDVTRGQRRGGQGINMPARRETLQSVVSRRPAQGRRQPTCFIVRVTITIRQQGMPRPRRRLARPTKATRCFHISIHCMYVYMARAARRAPVVSQRYSKRPGTRPPRVPVLAPAVAAYLLALAALLSGIYISEKAVRSPCRRRHIRGQTNETRWSV